ncbi:MAG: HAMP domain-containing sensor histidine kinase [Faecalimonas sp.]|nr:HAMP domain-containing sensor histidine kinase [Faecalimonas sp.]
MALHNDMEFLLSKFSHEIRNPLTTLSSTVQLIEMQHPEVKEFRHWSSLTYDMEYMNQLLDELSNYAKSERVNAENFDLLALLEKVTLSFAASIAQSEVEYTSKLDPRIGQFYGDSTKLQQVLLNLLKNALDASTPNGSIFLDASLQDNTIVISIKDTGCGISAEQLPTIFEPFVTYKKGGSGLGLAICEHVIKAHNGTITVDSTEGVGTTFCVTLPVK